MSEFHYVRTNPLRKYLDVHIIFVGISVPALSLQVSAECTILMICADIEGSFVATVVGLEAPRNLCFHWMLV